VFHVFNLYLSILRIIFTLREHFFNKVCLATVYIESSIYIFLGEPMILIRTIVSLNSFIPLMNPEMEFKEFEPRFKSAKTQFKLSAGLNLETFDTI